MSGTEHRHHQHSNMLQPSFGDDPAQLTNADAQGVERLAVRVVASRGTPLHGVCFRPSNRPPSLHGLAVLRQGRGHYTLCFLLEGYRGVRTPHRLATHNSAE